jgi:predicted acylesterase/phospholipase RssA/ABC-type phosphate/phosphonate transport system substrate-binding protein
VLLFVETQKVNAKLILMRPVTICLLVLLTFAHQRAFSQPLRKDVSPRAPLVIRVGAIYYDDSDAQYAAIHDILSALEKQSAARPVTFKLAVGTYDEIMNWYESDQIDLAIMNPGPLALLIDKFSHQELKNIFVGIRGRIADETSVASNDGANPRSTYNSLMLLNRDAVSREFPSSATPTDDELVDLVMRKAKQKKVHFLFVHPLSTSGYIFPRKVLKDAGIDLTAADYNITYSHDVSTKQVKDSAYDSSGRLQVAFVSDETRNTLSDNNVLAIRSGPLTTKILQDVLLLTPDFIQREPTAAESVKKLLRSSQGRQTFNLSTPDEWWKEYEEIKTWVDALGGSNALLSNTLTIDQIITRINNYNRHHATEPARVALVLSGGGAKCAYQLGAVEVIEERLKAAQTANPSQKLGIDLVVGTSGGAINALTIAAEVTKDSDRRPNLVSTWQSFGQSEILKPSNFIRRLLGLAFGLTLSLCVLCVVYTFRLIRWARRSGKPRHPAESRSRFAIINKIRRLTWAERVGIILLVLSLLFYLAGQRRITLASELPAEALLKQHVFVHIAEYSRQSLRWAALALFIFGLFLCVDSILAIRKQRYASVRHAVRPIVLMATIILSIILPVFALYRIFFSEKSLFVSEGIVDRMSAEIPRLLGSNVTSGSLPEISRDIIQKELIKRDLVITGSMISASAQPDTDLYFIYKAGPDPALPQKLQKDNRFVSLRDPDNASILLDAVIGSGSIFPAFEPRQLSGVKRIMDKDVTRDVAIIDGGFVHNSPIEAAVKLDATHIIVIEASPASQPKEEINLLNNSVTAFNHLFTQAQLLDARSRRQAEIYTLQPSSPAANGDPFLCTLDFGKNFIDRAVKWGNDDASDTKTPRFVRQPRPSGL